MKPFVMTIKWQPASKNESAARNVAYIGTRPGVQREQEPDRGADPETYSRYISQRPGSRGLFGADPATPPDLQATMHELRRSDSPTWRVILSLRGEDAEGLGYTDLAAWQDLTRRYVPALEKAMGLQAGQLRWVAAHHHATSGAAPDGHPHIHILCWLDPSAPARRGRLEPPELRDARRECSREIHGPLRAQHIAERTAGRDESIETARAALDRARTEQHARPAGRRFSDPTPTTEATPFIRTPAAEAALGQRLDTLGKHLPQKGRVALAYMPAEVKQEAREIADDLLRSPVLRTAYSRYDSATRELNQLYTTQPAQIDAAMQRAHADLRDRVAQAVLRSAAAIQRDRRFAASRTGQRVARVAEAAGVRLTPDQVRQAADALYAGDRAKLEGVLLDARGAADAYDESSYDPYARGRIEEVADKESGEADRREQQAAQAQSDAWWIDAGARVTAASGVPLTPGESRQAAWAMHAGDRDRLRTVLQAAAERQSDGGSVAPDTSARLDRAVDELVREAAQKAAAERQVIATELREAHRDATADARWSRAGHAQQLAGRAHGIVAREYGRARAAADRAASRAATEIEHQGDREKRHRLPTLER